MLRSEHLPASAIGNVGLSSLCSRPIIEPRCMRCAKETIREGGPETRVEFWRFYNWSGVMNLAEVRLQEGESIDNALRRFKRKVQTEDIIKEVKRHSFYLKPGAKRRVKQALARKRARKKIRKESD